MGSWRRKRKTKTRWRTRKKRKRTEKNWKWKASARSKIWQIYFDSYVKIKILFLSQDADRIRRDSIISEEIPKIKLESTVIKAEIEEAKIEIATPVLVTEEPDNQNGQNNVEDDFGIRAEALYDYQAGTLLI